LQNKMTSHIWVPNLREKPHLAFVYIWYITWVYMVHYMSIYGTLHEYIWYITWVYMVHYTYFLVWTPAILGILWVQTGNCDWFDMGKWHFEGGCILYNNALLIWEIFGPEEINCNYGKVLHTGPMNRCFTVMALKVQLH
jgi:hypothetical protein